MTVRPADQLSDCPSARPPVRPSARPPVRPSARRLADLPSAGLLTLLLTGAGSLSAQIVPLAAGGVEVTPDGGTDPGRNRTSSYSTTFAVKNTGTFQYTFTLSCARSGQVLTCENDLEQITLAAGASGNVPVQYTTGVPGTGTVSLTASRSGGVSDSGWVNVTVLSEGGAAVVFKNHNRDVQDRSLCLTTGGAGEAAAVGCGHLVVTHSTPGYATLGRTRALTLLYNSAQASPGAVLPITVIQRANVALPSSVFLRLRLTADTMVGDTATFTAWGGGATNQSRQAVLWFVQDTLSTGIYPFTLLARNSYPGITKDSTFLDTLIVVNRVKNNRYGAGWSLVGVERLHFNQPAGTNHLLWVGGDGSARWYRQLDATHWLASAAAYRDTIVLAGGQYTRTLRHGIQVVFDAAGRHIRTVARTGQATVFTWGGASGDSLLTVRVPPGGVSGTTYTVAYSAGKLDRITDPAGRVLDVTITANRLRSIVDPDTTVATQFAYDSTGPIPTLLRTRRTRRGFTTTFTHQGPLLTQASVPHDTTASPAFEVTGYAPWNSKGWVAHPHTTPQTAVDTTTVFTLVNGPRVGVADDARFWVDKWGAPVRIVGAISDTTKIFRGSTAAPALVTRLVRPDGMTDSLLYDGRANLLQDSTAYGGGTPPSVSRWVFDSSIVKDAPVLAIGPMNDTTVFGYNALGLTERVRAPNQHVTRFYYRPIAADSLQGLVERVSDSMVRVYSAMQASNDTMYQFLSSRFAFNARGNVASPMGRVRRLVRGTAERVDTVVDPAGHRTSYGYDAANRVRVVRVQPPAGAPDTTRYTWRLGILTQITDPRGVIRQYRYDPSGRTIGEVDDYSKLEQRWYSLAGQLDSVAPRAGSRVWAVYDSAGRRRKLSWEPNGALDSITYRYDIMGRMLRARQGNDSVTHSYHPSGLLKEEVTMRNGDRISVASGYDVAGRRTALRVGTAGNTTHRDSVSYVYAASGELAQLQVIWRNSTLRDTVRFVWDPLGRRDTLYYSNGIIARFEYDADGALRLLCSRGPVGPGGTAAFDFKSHVTIQNADGLPIQVNPATPPTSCVQGDPLPYILDSLAYDHKHQMVYRRRDLLETWQYDASGNRSFYARTGSPDRRDSILSGHNRLLYSGRLITPFGYRKYFYNDNGARTSEQACDNTGCFPAQTFDYDRLGRANGANGLYCPNDPLGRMAYGCQPFGLQLGYDGANVARTGHDEWGQGWTFIQGPGLDDPLFAKRGSDNLTHVFVTDGQGRQFAVGKRDGDPANLNILGASASGATGQSTTFDPTRLASPDLPEIAFFRNRWYDQYSGRWTQEDPIGMAGGVNVYQYAGNNPAVFADPFGLRVCAVGTTRDVARIKESIADATDTDITWDSDDCVYSFLPRGNKAFEDIQSGFRHMVFGSATFTLKLTDDMRSTQYGGDLAILVYRGIEGIGYYTGPFGKCDGRGRTFAMGQLFAHELIHHFPVIYGDSMSRDEQDAIVRGDNAYNAGRSRPPRCDHGFF